MHKLPVKINLAMQQPAAFKAMCGNIHVYRLHDWKAAEYRVAMMSRLIHAILAICEMRPNFFRDEFMLRSAWVVVIALGMARMLALHFLQKNDIGIQFTQAVAQLMQYYAAVEMRKTLVDVISGDFQRLHGRIHVRRCRCRAPAD